MIQKYKIAIVGGGTAGAIVSSYLKQMWGDRVEVIIIYDHSKPNIGIGESLTPMIYDYLKFVDITREELIKYVNCTVKLGIKFKNWGGDGKEFYHPFADGTVAGMESPYNAEAAYDAVNGQYDHDYCYGRDFFEHNRIPADSEAIQSLHIDGVLFSKFVIDKFKDRLTVIDDIVVDVVKKLNSEEISHLILKNSGTVAADFYFDCSGFASVLFKHLENEWVDKSDELPLDSCIPHPVITDHKFLPVCTTAESSKQGWILQVPLQNRWGCGYLYSSKFISDADAINDFSIWLKNKFSIEMSQKNVLKFKSGYWKKQWVGNCLAIGLSSGFAEPLEATNVHQAIFQVQRFTRLFNFVNFKFDQNIYNETMEVFYKRVYLFLRYAYTAGRNDSEFWNYMNNNVPEEIKTIDEKIKNDFLTMWSMTPSIFNFDNFTKLSIGQGKVDVDRYKNILIEKNMYEYAETSSKKIRQTKKLNFDRSIDHLAYVNSVKLEKAKIEKSNQPSSKSYIIYTK
jgi:tryptophan 7-halogenase